MVKPILTNVKNKMVILFEGFPKGYLFNYIQYIQHILITIVLLHTTINIILFLYNYPIKHEDLSCNFLRTSINSWTFPLCWCMYACVVHSISNKTWKASMLNLSLCNTLHGKIKFLFFWYIFHIPVAVVGRIKCDC